MKERGFDWWVARVRRSLALYDMVRLDTSAASRRTGRLQRGADGGQGAVVKAPGIELFERLKEVFGELPFIAEDLGLITPEVAELREHFGMPGMRILQFGFSDRGAHIYLPHQYVPNTVAYTGTHDNDTTLDGGRAGRRRRSARTRSSTCSRSAGRGDCGSDDACGGAVGGAAVHLSDAGHPAAGQRGAHEYSGEPAGNWGWRFEAGAMKPEIAAELAELMELTDRDWVEAEKESLARIDTDETD